MRSIQVTSYLLFEPRNLWPHDESLAVQDIIDCRTDLLPDRRILGFQIHQRNIHGSPQTVGAVSDRPLDKLFEGRRKTAPTKGLRNYHNARSNRSAKPRM